MRQLLPLFKAVVVVRLLLQFGCKDSGTGPSAGEWEFLGFEDKFALRLVLAEPYLYVCAGSNGLWRKNIRQPSAEGEFLGLADTSLGRFFNRGVQDIVVYPQWLIVAYRPDQGTDHVLFRTFNGGKNWTPADSGLEYYYGNVRYFHVVNRLASLGDKILAVGDEVYSSTNFGEDWTKVERASPIAHETYVIKFHPRQKERVWLGGENLYFSPVLSFSTDRGDTWRYVELSDFVAVDNAVYSIALDPEDVNVVYVGMQGAMIKTTDSGESWIVPLVTHRQGAFFRAIPSDPRDRNHLWAAAGKTIVETFDAGETWREIQSPNETQVLDMLWDDATQSVYVATESGIYRFKP